MPTTSPEVAEIRALVLAWTTQTTLALDDLRRTLEVRHVEAQNEVKDLKYKLRASQALAAFLRSRVEELDTTSIKTPRSLPQNELASLDLGRRAKYEIAAQTSSIRCPSAPPQLAVNGDRAAVASRPKARAAQSDALLAQRFGTARPSLLRAQSVMAISVCS